MEWLYLFIVFFYFVTDLLKDLACEVNVILTSNFNI